MSSGIEQFFNESQAVAVVLSELVQKFEPRDFEPGPEVDRPVITEEDFTALWQAVELLSRAVTYIHAQVQAEASRAALFLPAPVEKKATLYGPSGEAL